MTPLLKNSLIALGLISVAAAGYYMFVIRNDELTAKGINVVSVQAEVETQEFLSRLTELKTIKLPDTLFTDERFQALIDNSEPVDPQPVGRSNPFASSF